MSESADWPAILTAQGIDPAVISRAQANAEVMAKRAATLAQDPLVPIVPADLVTALLADWKRAQ